jgi:hypothetical protein
VQNKHTHKQASSNIVIIQLFFVILNLSYRYSIVLMQFSLFFLALLVLLIPVSAVEVHVSVNTGNDEHHHYLTSLPLRLI